MTQKIIFDVQDGPENRTADRCQNGRDGQCDQGQNRNLRKTGSGQEQAGKHITGQGEKLRDPEEHQPVLQHGEILRKRARALAVVMTDTASVVCSVRFASA